MSVYSQLADEDPVTLAHLLTGVRNTTRTWMNFGHTADEVGRDRVVTTEMASTDEIRRFIINPTDHSVRGVSFSTFAASAPKPIFIQTEDGLSEIDTSKFQLCTPFDEVVLQLQAVRDEDTTT